MDLQDFRYDFASTMRNRSCRIPCFTIWHRDRESRTCASINKRAIKAAQYRRAMALPLHWLLRPLGCLELTDVYKIDLANLPPLFSVDGYDIERANADDIETITQRAHRGEPPEVIRALCGRKVITALSPNSAAMLSPYNWISIFRGPGRGIPLRTASRARDLCRRIRTFPEHRGKQRCILLLLLTMLHFAAASGKSVAYTGASLF